jgi:hypothetical protein
MSKQSWNGNQNNISKLFDLVNSVIYAIAGFLFILVAFFALVYSIWNFIATIQSSHWRCNGKKCVLFFMVLGKRTS